MKRPVEEADIFRLLNLDEVTIDPTGKLVAFTVTQANEGTDGYRRQVHVYSRSSDSVECWTSPDFNSHAPKWSPDGRWLSFLSRRGSSSVQQLFILPRTGGEARAITDHSYTVTAYEWSPDGQSIVISAHLNQGGAREAGVDTPARIIETLQYKFNGRGFIYNQQNHLYLLDLQNGLITTLTEGDADDREPAWSPDGEWIAFVSRRHENREFDLGSDVFTVSRHGGPLTKVTQTKGAVESPTWSPDGRWLAYIGTERVNSMPNHRRVCRIPASGGEPELLSGGFDRTAVSGKVVWAQTGERIWATFEDEGRVSLLSVEVNERRVTGDRTHLSQIASFGVTDDGWIAAVRSQPTHPPELYVGASVRSLVQATHFHDDWCQELEMTEMESFTAVSRDGTVVPCWMMRPVPFTEVKRYPGILKIHGGPYAQFGYGFNHELQLLCAKGYAVFFSNPRGSSGYSEEWARALGRHRGIIDYEDVMACTDGAIEHFDFIDSDRLIVTGGSYGGYMTSWIVGHTNRFCAACSEAAPNNLYSMSGSSDLAGSNHRLVYGFSAQENPQFYNERSPISYTQDICTPLLIIHSENDLRVSIEQAEQLFVALKLQRKEVKFVRFPGENHALPRSGVPSHRLERFSQILSWFTDHLPVEGV